MTSYELRIYYVSRIVSRAERVLHINIANYGICGARNGGPRSGFFWDRGKLYYHYIHRCNTIECMYYIEINAIDLLKNILEKDVLEYAGRDFDFLFLLNEEMKSKNGTYGSYFPKRIINKREEKCHVLQKTKAIKLAIEILNFKIREKRWEKCWHR